MAEDILDYLQSDEPTIGIWGSFNYEPGSSGNVDYFPSLMNCPAVTLSHEEASNLPPYIVGRWIERFE